VILPKRRRACAAAAGVDNRAMPEPALRTSKPGWDLFCRVVDNYGDVGLCWRLAAELAERGQVLRLFIDDASALAWMAPVGHPGVQVLPFEAAATLAPAGVVVEAFGCDPPPAYVQAMAARSPAPVWLNLEYLSAEAYVERSHGLPSPQRNGLTKWFFYPGFTARTGGLLREDALAARQAGFRRQDWLAARSIAQRPGERLVSLFCYADPPPAALQAVLQALATQPTRLLLTPTAQPLLQALGDGLPPRLQCQALPWLSQHDYDHLLWSCALNFVRGEDSLVRAHWAGVPFVWHIYPQRDGVHAGKLDALLRQMQAAPAVAALWRAWNGTAPADALLPQALSQLLSPAGLQAWSADSCAWRAQLCALPELAAQLQGFVQSRARSATGRGRSPAC